MPKPKTREVTVIDTNSNAALVSQDVQTIEDGKLAIAQHASHVRAVALQVGYELLGDVIDADLIQRDIRANMQRSLQSVLEVGRGLLVLQAVCAQGEFISRLAVLDIEKSLAYRFMQASKKFSNVASTRLLTAAGNQTKLFEMLVLDDEEIDELTLTGQTGELSLDDVATMSVKELRGALRELRGKSGGDEADASIAIQNRDKRIRDLEKQLGQQAQLSREEVAEYKAKPLGALVADQVNLAERFRAEVEFLNAEGDDLLAGEARKALTYAVQQLLRVADLNHMPLDAADLSIDLDGYENKVLGLVAIKPFAL